VGDGVMAVGPMGLGVIGGVLRMGWGDHGYSFPTLPRLKELRCIVRQAATQPPLSRLTKLSPPL